MPKSYRFQFAGDVEATSLRTLRNWFLVSAQALMLPEGKYSVSMTGMRASFKQGTLSSAEITLQSSDLRLDLSDMAVEFTSLEETSEPISRTLSRSYSEESFPVLSLSLSRNSTAGKQGKSSTPVRKGTKTW